MRLIDADALWMDAIHTMDYCDDILELVERQPTIEPEPSQVAQDIATIIVNEMDMRVIGERKRGKWDTVIITITGGHKYAYYACSSCGIASDSEFDFCPNCGADMREE